MTDRLRLVGTVVGYADVMGLRNLRSTSNVTLMAFVQAVFQLDLTPYSVLYALLEGETLTLWAGHWGRPEAGLYVMYHGPCLVFEELGPEWGS